MKKGAPFDILPVSLIVVLICAVYLFWNFAVFLKRPIPALLADFSLLFYLPHANHFRPGMIGVHNVIIYFYVLIIAGTVIVYAFRWKSLRSDISAVAKMIFSVTLIAHILLTGWQTISQSRYFTNQIDRYHDQSASQRKALLYGEIYTYAESVRRLLPERCNARLVTDTNLKKDPGMLAGRALAYLLYPIDIRRTRGQPPDCLVVYNKANALGQVGPDYQVVKQFNDRNLVAVKKELLP